MDQTSTKHDEGITVGMDLAVQSGMDDQATRLLRLCASQYLRLDLGFNCEGCHAVFPKVNQRLIMWSRTFQPLLAAPL